MDPRTPLKTALDLYILEAQSRRHTGETLRFYRGRLGQFVRWCDTQQIVYLDDLTPHVLRAFLIYIDARGVSSAYHHSHARALRAFCNYCVRDDLLPVSPFARVQMPRLEKKTPAAIPAEHIRHILRACRYERDRAIVLMLLDSGVRASELCNLDMGDVDLESGAVRVRNGKGRKERVTYIGATTRRQVHRYLMREREGQPAPSAPLFIRQSAHGGRIAYDGLKQLFRRLSDASGVSFSAHAFRRTFAINSLRNGMNIYVLAQLMGHADISVLRAYLEILDDDLRTAHERAGVVDNL